MKPERLIELQQIEGFKVTVPTSYDLQDCVEILGKEFAHERYAEFAAKILKDINVSPEQIIQDPEHFNRSVEVFRLEDKIGQTVAVCASKYYSWSLIANQICFRINPDSNEMSLAHFGDLVAVDENPVIVAELAYNLVDQRYRGIGLGDKLFKLRLDRAKYLDIPGPKVAFTMSRGAHIESGEGLNILNFLLEKERKNNPGGGERVKITGIPTSIEEIYSSLQLSENYDLSEVHRDSRPIVKLAQKHGMEIKGLFKDLSPIFSKIVL